MSWIGSLIRNLLGATPSPGGEGSDDGQTIPPKAERRFQQGRAFGQTGRYDEALRAFAEAEKLAPSWAAPAYDAAFTYVLMDRPQEALEQYEKVDSMLPDGFFTAKTAIWVLRREVSGHYPQGTYRTYVSIEWEDNPSEKLDIAQRLVDTFPDFAPGWKELAVHAGDPEMREQYIRRGLACDPDRETEGLLRINEALVLRLKGSPEEAERVLEQWLNSGNATTGTRGMARIAGMG